MHHSKYNEKRPKTAVDKNETPDFSNPVKISFKKFDDGNPKLV